MSFKAVAQRYKQASSALWERAAKDLHEFNQRYEEFQGIKEPFSVKDRALLNDFAFRKNGTAPSFIGTDFYEWLSKCTLVSSDGHPDNPDTYRPSGNVYYDLLDGKGTLKEAIKGLERYKGALQKVVKETVPEAFTYQGFKISNNNHMSDDLCLRLLEGVDYLVGLFKKRGMSHLLKDGVSRIELDTELSQSDWAGAYYHTSKTICLSAKHLINSHKFFGKFVVWVNEIFLHEFGHYVHLNYITGEAKRVWDSAWDPVLEAKAKVDAINQTFKVITQEEMTRFFDLLVSTNWDPSKTAKKLTSLERVKFAYWLRNPMLGESLITEKQLRWTRRGLDTANFFKDPEKYLKEQTELVPGDDKYTWTLERRTKVFKERLGLGFSSPLSMSTLIVEGMAKLNPDLQKSVDDVISQLGIVSEYGKTNEKEDFAETFVAFLDAPETLTPNAKFRMQQALSLSGLYGKPVMHLANRYKQALTLGPEAVDRWKKTSK